MREGPRRIERQRRKNRKCRFQKILVRARLLLFPELRILQDVNACFFQRRSKLPLKTLARGCHNRRDLGANRIQLAGGVQAIGTGVTRARFHLAHQPGHPHHEELVQVRTQNRKKLHPLEQRVGRILRLFQYSALESKQAQFSIDEQVGVAQRIN